MLVVQKSIFLDTSESNAVSKPIMDTNEIIALVQSGKVGRDRVIEQYFTNKELKNSIRFLISKNNRHLVDEVFTDAIIAFVTACTREGFTIKSSIKNYIITAARNIYYKQIKQLNGIVSVDDDQLFESILHKHLDQIPGFKNADERSHIVNTALAQLDEKCKELLTRWANNTRMREIALRLNYKSEGMARKKKFQCLQKLRSFFTKNHNL